MKKKKQAFEYRLCDAKRGPSKGALVNHEVLTKSFIGWSIWCHKSDAQRTLLLASIASNFYSKQKSLVVKIEIFL